MEPQTMDTSILTKQQIIDQLIQLLVAWQPVKWWQRLLKGWLLKELAKQ